MALRGVVGVTTISTNTAEEIADATEELLNTLVECNAIELSSVAGVYWATSSDIDADFPACAAQFMGWSDIPQICTHEMRVPGQLPLTIRALLQVNTDKAQQDVRHVYLRGATALRPEQAKSASV